MDTNYSRDRFALQDLMLSYGASVDERDRARYAACFSDDVEVHNFGDRTFHGRDDWVEYVWSALDKYSATQHLLGMQWASIDGDLASTRTDVQAMHIMADSEQRFTLWASYLTRMRREGDQWLIYRHELAVRATELA